MIMWIGWVVAGVLLIWFIFSYRYSHKKRLHLNYYLVYLLLNDAIREDQKAKLIEFIKTSDKTDSTNLASEVFFALEKMADDLANADASSVLGSAAMIWSIKKDNV